MPNNIFISRTLFEEIFVTKERDDAAELASLKKIDEYRKEERQIERELRKLQRNKNSANSAEKHDRKLAERIEELEKKIEKQFRERISEEMRKFDTISTLPGSKALITKAISTYPVGHIVVGEAKGNHALDAGQQLQSLSAGDLRILPFYKNGDLLSGTPDLKLVQNEILADRDFVRTLFYGISASRDISVLLFQRLKELSGLTVPEFLESTASAAIQCFTGVSEKTGHTVGIAKELNRKNWLESSRDEGTWEDFALQGIRHFVAEELDPLGDSRKGSTVCFPHYEYTRVRNAMAQLHFSGCDNGTASELKSLYGDTTYKPTQDYLDTLNIPVEFNPPRYLGELESSLKESLCSKSFALSKPEDDTTRSTAPPLPCYYSNKLGKLRDNQYLKVRDWYRDLLKFLEVDEPSRTASLIMTLHFDQFMHDKQFRQVNIGTMFKSYLPKTKPFIEQSIRKMESAATEDYEIANRLALTSVRSTGQIFDQGRSDKKPNEQSKEDVDLMFQRAKISPVEQIAILYSKKDAACPPHLASLIEDFEKLPSEEKRRLKKSAMQKLRHNTKGISRSDL